MLYMLMVVIFVLGYTAIALEHPLRIDKAASALVTGVLIWTILILGGTGFLDGTVKFTNFLSANPGLAAEGMNTSVLHYVDEELLHHLGEIASILFFLLGAMTIVELIDAHEGFAIVTDKIVTQNKVKLLWVLCIITFFFSAALDNLTTSIVMAALLKKLIKDKGDLWFFAGMIVIAANAGGAWSPIGDVTTIMLWIGGQVTAFNITTKVIIPSMICMLVPLIIASFMMKGNVTRPQLNKEAEHIINPTSNFERNLIFIVGVCSLIFVPIFKMITHLPPYMGILFGLGVLWIITEILHRSKNYEEKTPLSVVGVMRKVDVPSVLFFLGILVAVAGLQSAGHLREVATWLDKAMEGNIYTINILIGLLSSIVDNVPLVAGAMGMYDMSVYPQDHTFWELLAYCAGTGGSALIIGSAAGVAIMGILKIDFIWYLKRMSLLAIAGYFAGVLTFYLMFY